MPEKPGDDLTSEMQLDDLRNKFAEVCGRMSELERENVEFAAELVELEERNTTLTTLYTALSRLHSTLDRKELTTFIFEIVINILGAERFALFLLNDKGDELNFVAGEGFEDVGSLSPTVPLGDSLLGQAISSAEVCLAGNADNRESEDFLKPLLAAPLQIPSHKIGVLAIYRWLEPTTSCLTNDRKLLEMICEHAAAALFCSLLYARSERQRQTYQEVVDLLIT